MDTLWFSAPQPFSHYTMYLFFGSDEDGKGNTLCDLALYYSQNDSNDGIGNEIRKQLTLLPAQ